MGYLAIICILALNFHWTSSCKYRVCYYLNWSQYRPGPSSFMPEYILPFMCTHVMYAYAKIKNNIIVPTEGNDLDSQWSAGTYSRVVALRRRDPRLKILLSVGGYFFGGLEFSLMAANATGRKVFINYAMEYLRKNDFDGLDLAWEFPTKMGGHPSDKQSFTVLLQELSEAFMEESVKNMMPRLLLTTVLAPGKNTIDNAYEVDQIDQYVDFAMIKAFNYHGGFDTVADHNSPLYSMSGDSGDFLTVNFTVNYYLTLGFPKEKLVLGLALYGRNSWLVNGLGMEDAINKPIDGDGPSGLSTQTRGFYAYYEYCMQIKENLIGRRGRNPYAVFKPDKGKSYFLAYEDSVSVRDKVQLVLDKGLLGIMFWSLDYDDFNGRFCDEGKFPLTNSAIDQCTHPERRPPPPQDKPLHKPDAKDLQDTQVPKPEVTEPPIATHGEVKCEEDGIFEYPPDCFKYVLCTDGYPYIQPCPMARVYNREEHDCNLPFEMCWTSSSSNSIIMK